MGNSPFQIPQGMLQGGAPTPEDLADAKAREEQAMAEQLHATAVHLASESAEGDGFAKTADLLKRAKAIAHFLKTGMTDG